MLEPRRCAGVGGTAGAAAGLNESSGNAVTIIPVIQLLVRGISAGGPIAAQACLASQGCRDALYFGGVGALAMVTAIATPPPASNNTGNTTPPPNYGGSTTFPVAKPIDTSSPGTPADQPQPVTTTGGSPIATPLPGGNTTVTPVPTPQGVGIVMSQNGANGGVNPALLNELAANGVRFTPENVIVTARGPNGQIVFLETGNSSAGLLHIIQQHGSAFANIGVSEAQIPSVVIQALTQGRIVGYQGSGTTRPIYEITINGQPQRIAITTGNNGFIVGANPSSTRK